MSYSQGSYRRPAWIGVVVALGLLVWFCGPALRAPRTAKVTNVEDVERALFAGPDTGRLYKTIQRTHPDEFDRMTREVLRRSRAGETPAQIDEAIIAFLTEVAHRYQLDMAEAPSHYFAAYRAAEIGVMEKLQAGDVKLCATYVMTGSVRVPDGLMGSKSPLVDLNVARWKAMAAGRDTPVARKQVDPPQSDWRLVEDGMRAAGVKPATIAAFFDEKVAAGLPAVEQCAGGLGFARAVHALPREHADRVYAFLVRSEN